jgi:hypothetical protein
VPDLIPLPDLPVTVDLGRRLGRVSGIAIYRHRHPLRGWRYLVQFRLGGYLFRWWISADHVRARELGEWATGRGGGHRH